MTLWPNQGTFTPFLSNRWYRVELQGVLDTTCSNKATSPWSGCNGEIRAWVDGVLVSKYTGVNLGGAQCGVSWYQLWPLEDYFHFEYPPWGGTFSVDNIVVSNMTGITPSDTPVIGAAIGEYPSGRGTGDPASPYGTIAAALAWLGRHTAGDCTKNGYLGHYVANKYRSGGSLDPTITRSALADGCNSSADTSHTVAWLPNIAGPDVNTLMYVVDGRDANDCTVGGGSTPHNCRWNGSAWVGTTNTDNSLKITLTNNSDGGGVFWERQDAYAFGQWVQHGWIYLPSSNNYTVTNLALAGFTASTTTPSAGYVALSVSGGNWSVDQKSTSGTPGALVSGTAVTFDTWHEYELIVWKNGVGGCASQNGCVTLMIDRTRIYTVQSLPQSAAWVFTGSLPVFVVGIIDFQGTPPFTAYFDDQSITTVSAWSCDGWGSASCPGVSPPPPPPPPPPLSTPTNLVVQ